ncbi:MAG: nuclease-related domain-containing protein [Leptolyngbyaceae cyanobacterium bins.59]|nr:nuclease-related domain-containing protein [Leptolyngbyaceae cyanobacterium bins.59]
MSDRTKQEAGQLLIRQTVPAFLLQQRSDRTPIPIKAKLAARQLDRRPDCHLRHLFEWTIRGIMPIPTEMLQRTAPIGVGRGLDKWVSDKQRSERNQHKEALKGILPGSTVEFLSGLNQFEQSMKGSMGEAKVFLDTLIFLPNSWILFNDVFLQPASGKFAQIDHLLISPVGVFIILPRQFLRLQLSVLSQSYLTPSKPIAVLQLQRLVASVRAISWKFSTVTAITSSVCNVVPIAGFKKTVQLAVLQNALPSPNDRVNLQLEIAACLLQLEWFAKSIRHLLTNLEQR